MIHNKNISEKPTNYCKFTSIVLLIILGNTARGNRSKLNNANETNAFSAVKILSFDENT